MAAFIRKQRPRETVKCEYFYSKIDEEWEVMEKRGRTKGYELSKVGET